MVHKVRSFWPLYRKGKKRPNEEADHSKLIGGRIHKQENLPTRLVLGSHKVSESPHLPARNLKAYREALTGPITSSVQMVSTPHCSLKATSGQGLPPWGWWVKGTWYIAKIWWGVGEMRSHPLLSSLTGQLVTMSPGGPPPAMPNKYVKKCHTPFGQTTRICPGFTNQGCLRFACPLNSM